MGAGRQLPAEGWCWRWLAGAPALTSVPGTGSIPLGDCRASFTLIPTRRRGEKRLCSAGMEKAPRGAQSEAYFSFIFSLSLPITHSLFFSLSFSIGLTLTQSFSFSLCLILSLLFSFSASFSLPFSVSVFPSLLYLLSHLIFLPILSLSLSPCDAGCRLQKLSVISNLGADSGFLSYVARSGHSLLLSVGAEPF